MILYKVAELFISFCGRLSGFFISIPNYAFFIFAFVQKYAKILSKTIQNYAFTLKKSRNSVIWLEDSNLVHVCRNVYEPYLPLAANSKENEFKLYYNDTGLLLARYGFQIQKTNLFCRILWQCFCKALKTITTVQGNFIKLWLKMIDNWSFLWRRQILSTAINKY